MDTDTIRVLRDIAEAVVTGIREARGEELPPAEGALRVILGDGPRFAKPKPVDIVASVCSELARALNKHLPEYQDG